MVYYYFMDTKYGDHEYQLWGESNIETQTKMTCLQDSTLKRSF